jgi:hypothetical protein
MSSRLLKLASFSAHYHLVKKEDSSSAQDKLDCQHAEEAFLHPVQQRTYLAQGLVMS